MGIGGRDRRIVNHVAGFKQLTSPQVRALDFWENKSQNPCHEVLRRLVNDGYLARIRGRSVGGQQGGSVPFVYQLGPLAWEDYHKGRYRPRRAVDYHALAIADMYISVLQLERAGTLQILGYSREPDCHVEIDGHHLKPDLYIEIKGRHPIWLEVDMGTEGQRHIKQKMLDYRRAYEYGREEGWPEHLFERDEDGRKLYDYLVDDEGNSYKEARLVFPDVIFAAVDEYRADELRWILRQEPEEAQPLFKVLSMEEWPAWLA